MFIQKTSDIRVLKRKIPITKFDGIDYYCSEIKVIDVIQQKHFNMETGESTWEDIPIVEE